MKSLLTTLIVTVAAVSISCGPAEAEKKGEGALAPAFTLSDLNGKAVNLSDFQGKVIILDFWATWCPPCREEIPHFIALYNKHKDKGLVVLGVALDNEGAAAVRPFAQAHGINYPLVIGDQKVTQAYGGIRGIPTTFVIDRKGRIVQKYIGYRDEQVFESAIQPLL